jgi:hypothetical protein
MGFVRRNVANIIGVTLIAIGCLSVVPTPSFSTPAFASGSGGGPMVLDGMDPACHAVFNEGTENYIAKVLDSVYSQSLMPGNNGKIAILGVGSSVGGCGSDWDTQIPIFLSSFDTAPEVEFFNTEAEIDTFFGTNIVSDPPRVIWIPDDWGRSEAISGKFTDNAEKIADYVNSGGGLFANYNTFGWLTALLPDAVFNDGGCNGGPDATADGTTDFGLTNADVVACWHGYFTGDLGGLKTLAEWEYPTGSSSRVAVSIGGGEVSLPSSFTLTISPENPNAGEDLIITAVAQTLDGTPQEGVEVTVTVSSGPDAGEVLTATTDASGVATITVRTESEGTAVYTATATVNGVEKTVSATVSWNPPTTTTEAPTTTAAPTTTQAPTTTEAPTTTAAPTTTEAPVPETTEVPAPAPATTESPTTTEVAPTTTEHDHSSHDHGVLPVTGGSTNSRLILAVVMINAGILTIGISSIRRKAASK